MDTAHDNTMTDFKGHQWTVENDVQVHVEWSEHVKGRPLTASEQDDVRTMLTVRGVLQAPPYDDEPARCPAGLRGGGGHKRSAGMQPPSEAKRKRISLAASGDEQHAEPPADEAPRGPSPEPPPVVGRTMTQEMAGSSALGWYCSLLRRHIGVAVPRPAWYMVGDAHAVHAGVQVAATCGLHAVNHALRMLNGFVPFTWGAFDARARDDERKIGGDWEYNALQRNIQAAGARMHPVQVDEHEDLPRSIWRPGHVGCVMHTPGHWVALTPPDEPQTSQRAALLCDSLHTRPYALSTEELGAQRERATEALALAPV